MIQEIVNEMHNNQQLMECFESVTAIDDETLLFVNMGIQAGEITRIIKDHGYEIKDTQDYTIVNGETIDAYRTKVVHAWINNNMPEDINRWSEEGRQEERRLAQLFFEYNTIQKEIRIITIEPYSVDVQKMYKEWKERRSHHMTAKKLIKELEKLDPDTIICGMDNEYGEYSVSYVSKVHTHRSCPDCHSCGCVHCNSRKMFERKYVVLE